MNQLFKSIIVDDEKLARSRLRRLIGKYPDCFTIIDEAENGEQALAKIEEQKPDLIFLDIQMPGLNGFEMLHKLKHNPVVIFTTAFEEYAIKAFEQNSIDYLLKPIEPERLEITVRKLQKLKTGYPSIDTTQLLDIIERIKPKVKISSIPVKIGDKIFPIRLEDVIYFEAKDKYVFIHNNEGKEYLLDLTLSTLEEKLPEHFIRVHRAFIINKEKIKEISKYFNSKYTITMKDQQGSKIVSGSSFSEQVRSIFEI